MIETGPDLMCAVLRSRVYEVARETPLERAERLSRRLGSDVFLKREDLQPVFSFKLRGAHNKIAHLSDAERALAAFEVPERDLDSFRGFLEGLGYWSIEESENTAYHLFLST